MELRYLYIPSPEFASRHLLQLHCKPLASAKHIWQRKSWDVLRKIKDAGLRCDLSILIGQLSTLVQRRHKQGS